MSITWTTSMATGISDLDTQYEELFRQTNLLIEAQQQGQSQDRIREILDFFNGYITCHFTVEERYMTTMNSPAATENREAHTDFLEKFNIFRKRFDGGASTSKFVREFSTYLSTWLVDHVAQIDEQFSGVVDRHTIVQGSGV